MSDQPPPEEGPGNYDNCSPRQCRALAQRFELGGRDVAVHRRHAAIGAGRRSAPSARISSRRFDGRGDLFRRLDLVGGDIDHADQNVLALEQRASACSGTLRMDALERNLLDLALRQRRENLLVLAPLAAERVLPVDIGLDAVAVADVHGGGAFEALDGAMQRLDAPGPRPRP